MNRVEIQTKLKAMADKDFLKFHAALCPGCDNILGIRTPQLKDFAKALSKENDILNYMNAPLFDYTVRNHVIWLYPFQSKNVRSSPLSFANLRKPHYKLAVCDSPMAAFNFIKKNRSFYEPSLELIYKPPVNMKFDLQSLHC